MKNIYRKPSAGSVSLWKRWCKKAGLLTVALMGTGFSAFAVLSTQTWQESHRGYSIELIPGTGEGTGNKSEYVAAGTIYDVNRPFEYGWHFIRMDENGVVMASRFAWCTGATQHFRVVDIVALGKKEFRIIIQAKSVTRDDRAYIYVHGVDYNGNDVLTNPDITLWSDDPYYRNIYPTHALYTPDGLFISGYAAHFPDWASYLAPDNNFTDKLGMIMKVDIHKSPVTHNQYFWNSVSGAYTDYDMALKLAPYSYYSTYPLLITGAMNEGTDVCGIMIGKVNSSGNMTAMSGVEYTYPFSTPDQVKGIYGVDIRGQVASNGREGGDILILANTFDEERRYEKTWGVIRIQDNLTTYPSSWKAMRYKTGTQGWANQFLEQHFTFEQADHIHVVGQQMGLYDPSCITLPSGALAPSQANINPFIAKVDVGNSYWSPGAGFVYVPVGPMFYRNLYLSSQGTRATNLDYLAGSLFYGAATEDVSRLYTFAALGHYYDDPKAVNPPEQTPGMILPIGEDPASTSNDLRLKFLGIDTWTYDEPNCMEHTDQYCEIGKHGLEGTYNVGTYESYDHKGVTYIPGYSIFGLEGLNYLPVNIDCSTGYYKIGEADREIRVYPNPVSTELNLQLTQTLGATDAFCFRLSDVTGKEVFRTHDSYAGSSLIRIGLPALAAGTYIAEISLNGTQSLRKITIR